MFPSAMSTEEITDSGFVVPNYNKDNKDKRL